MVDTTPPPPGEPPWDPRPRLGPRGELVSEDGRFYWTGKHWVALEQPFAALPGANRVNTEPTYDTPTVIWVAVISSIVLSIGVAVVVFSFPPAIVGALLLAVAAAVFLVLAKDSTKTVKSWAFGLLIGAGVALLISPGAACFGLFMGPTAY